MLETTTVGSLPKPEYLAETEKLWPAWRLAAEALARAKERATAEWLRHQERAGIDILNAEAKAMAAAGVDLIQFDEPAFNVFMRDVKDWGIDALHRAIDGLSCKTAVHIWPRGPLWSGPNCNACGWAVRATLAATRRRDRPGGVG